MSEVHAIFSPSGAAAWMRCAGKPAMEFGLPNESSKYSEEGTAAHTVASWCLEGNKDAAAFIGRRVDLGTRTIEVTQEMAADVQIYVDHVREFANGHTLLVEQKVPLSHITGEEGAEGTSDAIIITADGEELILVDLKFGKGVPVYAFYYEDMVVSPEAFIRRGGAPVIVRGNEQLMMYASGAYHQFSALGDFKRIRIVIDQPRLNHLSEWDCTVEDLVAFETRARECATVARIAYEYRDNWVGKDNGYLSPSDKACRWCRAKAVCPALKAKVMTTITGDDFENLDNPPAAVEASTNNIKSGFYGNELLAKLFGMIDLIEQWCSAVGGRVESELLAGNEVPGYKLVQGKKGNRSWSSEEAVEKEFKSMRLKHEQMYNYKLISPADAEKLLKSTPKRLDRIKPLWSQSEGKPHVAPVSDKRPALQITPAADDFAVVETADDLV